MPGEVRERATAAAGVVAPAGASASAAAAGRGDHAADLRTGAAVPVTLGADAVPIGDLGHPDVAARLAG